MIARRNAYLMLFPLFQVFSFLRGLPKGAALHTHDLSIASVAWVVSDLTYLPGLYLCEDSGIRFAWLSGPTDDDEGSCDNWVALVDRRAEVGEEAFDRYLVDLLTINVDNPEQAYPDINAVWSR